MPFKKQVSVSFAFKHLQIYNFSMNHFSEQLLQMGSESRTVGFIPFLHTSTLLSQTRVVLMTHLASLRPVLQFDLAWKYATPLWPEDGNEKWGFKCYTLFLYQALCSNASSLSQFICQSLSNRDFWIIKKKKKRLHLYRDELLVAVSEDIQQ